MPFENRTDDEEQEYFADGMTGDLITDLSKLSGLIVIARNSVFTYKGRNVKVQDVAKDLNVTHVLEGSVRRVGGRVRINAQLIDAKTGAHLWAETFDRDFTDIFDLQDDVTQEIIKALKLSLSPEEKTKLASQPTTNLKAYNTFLRARQARYRLDDKSMGEALALYDQAIELDPNFADAHAGAATVARSYWQYAYLGTLMGTAARNRAEQAIIRALALQPNHPRALLERSRLLSLEGLAGEAIKLMEQVVSADPNNATAHRVLATVLAFDDQSARSVMEIETALRLDPKLKVGDITTTGLVYFAAGDYEKAASYFHDATIRAPKSQIGYDGLLVSYAMLDRLEEARVAVKNRLRLLPSTSVQFLALFIEHTGPDLRQRWLDAARKAGIPEWPFGFKGNEADRLKGDEIANILFGRRL